MSASRIFYFGPWRLNTSQIFYESALSLGIVNLKPIVPGHVLIISKRVCPRFVDLSVDEVDDLFRSVHKISRVIETQYSASACNISMQDGPDAGQSVPHVHIHILPRRPSDFKRNDDVYEELDQHDASIDFERERIPRAVDDMAVECTTLQKAILDYFNMQNTKIE